MAASYVRGSSSSSNNLDESISEDLTSVEVLPGYADVKIYSQALLKSCLNAVKASNGLPSSGDDFDYYSSFRGFRQLMAAEGRHILDIMASLLRKENQKVRFDGLELEDKFDLLVEANDFIMENVGHALDESAGLKKNNNNLVVSSIRTSKPINTSWNRKSFGNKNTSSVTSYRLLSGKNILRPQLKFKEKVDNSNSPFVPIITEKPNALKPFSILIEKTENGEEFSHPYEFEIDRFQPVPEHVEKAKPQVPLALDKTPFIFINKLDELEDLCDELLQNKEIAVDLEHHSYRTFQGITCLMQISTRDKDYVIDTLNLRSELQILNIVFTNPKIVKVMHGADMDILWLQRDFGLYIVNLFDTGQASRVFKFDHFSLSFLLKHYCQVEPDKKYQLADWRIRPLPEEMIRYAREDTHYLLYIYDLMKNDLLVQGNDQKNLLLSVFQRSKIVCLKKYQKPIFHEDSFLELYKKSKKVFNSRQLYALKKLYAWRDKMARQEDESLSYVLPNHMLLQIAETLPREQQGILAFCNPIPPLVRQQLNELHSYILKARDALLIKPEGPELRLQVSAAESRIDLDSVLHCVHDMAYHQDNVINLPTLLDDTDDHPSDSTPRMMAPLKDSPVLSLFDSSENPLQSKMKKVAAVFKSFISPYERYKLVKPFQDAVKMEQTESEEVSDASRIERIHDHFKRLAAMAGPPTTTTTVEENCSNNSELPSVIENAEVTSSLKNADITSSQNNEMEDEYGLPLLSLRKHKKKKKQKLASDIPLKRNVSNSVQSAVKKAKISTSQDVVEERKPFLSFDYRQTDFNIFKGGSIAKSSWKKRFNPNE